jgi:protein gp37
MGRNSPIEWTTHSHNFWYGCRKVSPGCAKCYAERDMKRFGRDFGAITKAKQFAAPLSWREPALVFTCSWSDFFIAEADAWRDEAWQVIRDTPHLTYQILTKRPENMADRLPADWGERGYPNVWLGVSAETQRYAHERIPILLSIPARLHFLSAEPLLGPLDISRYLHHRLAIWPGGPIYTRLEWVIAGGESDLASPRPAALDWFRSLRDQCAGIVQPWADEFGNPAIRETPFFLKQIGGNSKVEGSWGGNLLDGVAHQAMPELESA